MVQAGDRQQGAGALVSPGLDQRLLPPAFNKRKPGQEPHEHAAGASPSKTARAEGEGNGVIVEGLANAEQASLKVDKHGSFTLKSVAPHCWHDATTLQVGWVHVQLVALSLPPRMA